MTGRIAGLAWIVAFAVWAAPAAAWAVGGEDALLRCAIGAVAVALARIPRPAPSPRFDPLALALALGAPVANAVAARWFPLDTVHALAAVATGYGLLGLYVPRGDWQRLRALALLAAALLPVGTFVDVLVGWPLRKASAGVAAALLGGVPVETVIRVDGAVAFVDLPCAGVGSLTTGAALLLLATLAGRKPVDLAWAALAAVSAAVLLAGNTARVAAVVGLHHGLGWPVAAEVVHVPLGLLAFAAAGGVAVLLLRRRPEVADGPDRRPPLRVAPGVGVAVLALAVVLGGPAPPPVPTDAPTLPPEVTVVPPTAAEAAFAEAHGAGLAKGRLPEGTVVLVASRSWLAHHVPEQCLEAAGWRLDDDRPDVVAGLPLRVARARRDGRTATAVWWFQSASTVTDDAVVRIRGGVAGSTWVLVSVLLDGEPAPERIAEIVQNLRASVRRDLEAS